MLLNKCIAYLENSRTTVVCCFLLLLGLLLASLHFTRGGVLHTEPQSFIFNYLDNRPLALKIFDFNKNDWGFYQARELSYLFDLIDSYFVFFSIKLGLPHFYSITYFICLVIIVTIFNYSLTKYIGLRSILISTFLTGLFLTAPSIFFSNNILRSAKILTATFLLFIIYILFRILAKEKLQKRSLFSLGIVSLLLSLSDRQGYFFLLSLTAIFFVLWIIIREKKYFSIFLVFLISSIFINLYTYKVGPYLIQQITGFNPSLIFLKPDFLSYTREDPRWIITDTNLKLWSFFVDALLFLIDNIAYFFGNVQRMFVVTGLFLSIIIAVRSWILEKNRLKSLAIFVVVILSFVSILIMIFFMLIKEPQIVWPGIRRVYYSPSINLLILIFTSYISSRILFLWSRFKPIIITIILIALMSNIISLPEHFKQIQYGVESDEYKVFEYSPRLLQCLKNSKSPEAFYQLPKEVENVCRKLRN